MGVGQKIGGEMGEPIDYIIGNRLACFCCKDCVKIPWYRLALFIGATAVAANGFLGGAMIYGLDHYAW